MDNSENSERLLEFEMIHSGQDVDKPRYSVLRKSGYPQQIKDIPQSKNLGSGQLPVISFCMRIIRFLKSVLASISSLIF